MHSPLGLSPVVIVNSLLAYLSLIPASNVALLVPFFMASHGVELPVFAESNLGTRMVVSVSPHNTAGDLKGKLEREHFLCFPYLGEIRVNSLKVKRKSWLYHLPNSISMLLAFQGLKGNWFIHMDVASVLIHTKNREIGQNQLRAEGASFGKGELLEPAADALPVSSYREKGELLEPAADALPVSSYRENILSNAVLEQFDEQVNFASAQSNDGENAHIKFTFQCGPLDESKRGQCRCHHDAAENPVNRTHNFGKRKRKLNDSHDGTRKDLEKGSHLSSKQIRVVKTGAISNYTEVHGEAGAQNEFLRIDPVVRTSLSQHASDSQLQHGRTGKGMVVDLDISEGVQELGDRKDNIGSINGEKSERENLCGDSSSKRESVFTSNGDVCEHQTNWLGEARNNAELMHQEEKGTTCSSDRTSGVCLSDAVSVTGILEQYFSNLDEVTSPAKSQIESSFHQSQKMQTRDVKKSICKSIPSCKKMKNSIKILPPSCPSNECVLKYKSLKTRMNRDRLGELAIDITQQATESSQKSSHLASPTLPSMTLCSTIGKHEIGKRLLVAGLGRSTTKPKQRIASYCSSGRKLFVDGSSYVRTLVFDVADDDHDD